MSLKLHVRMKPALDDLLTLQICCVKGSRRVRVGPFSKVEVAHQQLPSTISFEARITKARTDFELPRLSLRIVRLEASHIGGKLAREVKAADMNNLQAVIY